MSHVGSKERAMARLNDRIAACTGCPLAKTRTNALCGEGAMDTRIMLVALSPGRREDACNRMFIGPSGVILERLLQSAAIGRDEIYMTNLVKCVLPKNRRPTMDEIRSCIPFLTEEIAVIDPQIIVPLGYYAIGAVLGIYGAVAPPARRDYARLHGRLILSRGQAIFPVPHPSSILYRPAFEPRTTAYYRQLAVLMRTCPWYSRCPMGQWYDRGVIPRPWIDRYCRGLWNTCIRYRLLERGDTPPKWMLPDGTGDEGLRAR